MVFHFGRRLDFWNRLAGECSQLFRFHVVGDTSELVWCRCEVGTRSSKEAAPQRMRVLDGDEFSSVGCVDVGDSGGVVDGCGVARGCFISVVFST